MKQLKKFYKLKGIKIFLVNIVGFFFKVIRLEKLLWKKGTEN